MKKSQSGFTLIELVVVIVLLGILGVTALGKFQDLSGEARAAAVDGIASEISAASAINYAKSIVGTEDVVIGSGGTINADGATDVCTAAALANLMSSGIFPTGYSFTANSPDCATTGGLGIGGTYTCAIADASDATATATATLICTDGT